MTAITADGVGNLRAVLACSRETLVVMGVSGQESVRPNANFLANDIELALQLDAPNHVKILQCKVDGGLQIAEHLDSVHRYCA